MCNGRRDQESQTQHAHRADLHRYRNHPALHGSVHRGRRFTARSRSGSFRRSHRSSRSQYSHDRTVRRCDRRCSGHYHRNRLRIQPDHVPGPDRVQDGAGRYVVQILGKGSSQVGDPLCLHAVAERLCHRSCFRRHHQRPAGLLYRNLPAAQRCYLYRSI